VHFAIWGLYHAGNVIKSFVRRKLQMSTENCQEDETFEEDIEEGSPRFPMGSFMPKLANDVGDSGQWGRTVDEFIFDANTWTDSLRVLKMHLRARGSWWEWVGFLWTFDSDFKHAHADVSFGGWTIPSEFLSARLEPCPDRYTWMLSVSWLEGEPEILTLKRKKKLERLSADVIVVGAGMQGLCFARDLASLGYKILVCERSSQIGGVWATNNYPGLRMHSPGYSYRCATLVPSWNLNHAVEEEHRPTRDEILDYCKELSNHKNIVVRLSSSCDYKKAKEVSDGIVVPIAGAKHKARFLFVSVNTSIGYQGHKNLPVALPTNFTSLPRSPICFHSSEFSKEALASTKRRKTQVIVVGSGKAAIDLLQLFDPGDKSVIWSHRGHTAFFLRSRSVLENIARITEDFRDEAIKEGAGRHWSELALEDGSLIACEGPMTKQRVKTYRGICEERELEHANSFEQFYFQYVRVNPDGSIALMWENGSDLTVDEHSTVIWCTGQRNPAFDMPKFKGRLAMTGFFSGIIPMCVTVSLFYAIQQLRGANYTRKFMEDLVNSSMQKIDPQTFGDDRSVQEAVLIACQSVMLAVFECDPGFHPCWRKEWYKAGIPVVELFDKILRSEIKKIVSNRTAGDDEQISIPSQHERCVGGDSFAASQEHEIVFSKEPTEVVGEVRDVSENVAAQTRTFCLEDYERFHNMTSSVEYASTCLRSFTGVVLLIPHHWKSRDPSLTSYLQTPDATDYFALTLTRQRRESTLNGQTTRLVGRDLTVKDPESFASDHDSLLCMEPYVFDFVKARTGARSLTIVRHYEYSYDGAANVSVIMLHIKSDNGLLSLVEVYRQEHRSSGQELG